MKLFNTRKSAKITSTPDRAVTSRVQGNIKKGKARDGNCFEALPLKTQIMCFLPKHCIRAHCTCTAVHLQCALAHCICTAVGYMYNVIEYICNVLHYNYFCFITLPM